MRQDEIQCKIEYFKSPTKLYSPKELIDNPSIIPRERGIYGWYFNVLPTTVPAGIDYIEVDGYKLLYIGIAGNQNNSKGDLRRRILGNHLGKHTTGNSTLRRTLGQILADELNLVKQPKGDRYWFGIDGEHRLRNWMIDHARIAFMLYSSPQEIEAFLINQFGQFLPLNKQGNRSHELYEL